MITSILALLMLQSAAGAAPPAAAAAPPPPKCEGAPYEAFDFWVGDWDVYPTGKDKLVAHSRIEKLYAGCAIRENWKPLSGNDGGSLTGRDPATGSWHQTWIGGGPGVVQFDGGPTPDGRMVLTGRWAGSGPNGEDGITRMTYSRVDGGAVRQHGEFSADQGLSWVTSFDFTYRPSRTETAK